VKILGKMSSRTHHHHRKQTGGKQHHGDEEDLIDNNPSAMLYLPNYFKYCMYTITGCVVLMCLLFIGLIIALVASHDKLNATSEATVYMRKQSEDLQIQITESFNQFTALYPPGTPKHTVDQSLATLNNVRELSGRAIGVAEKINRWMEDADNAELVKHAENIASGLDELLTHLRTIPFGGAFAQP